MNRSILWLDSGDGIYVPYVDNGVFFDGRLKTLRVNGFIPRQATKRVFTKVAPVRAPLPERGPFFVSVKPAANA